MDKETKPEIICMCGSTRFADLMAVISWEFEKQGKVVLRVNYLPDWYGSLKGHKTNSHWADQEGLKEVLDTLHFRKIDMSDKVYVCNYKGYIGESTSNELAYAKTIGKPIMFLEGEENEMTHIINEILTMLLK